MINEFPFLPSQPDVAHEPAIQPKRKVESLSNLIIWLAIPFPGADSK